MSPRRPWRAPEMSFWESHWYRGDHAWASLPLSAAALLYRAGFALRPHTRPITIPDVRVISVGNLNVGGTGKTPAVISLARAFLSRGERVAVLTRGYGRTASSPCDFDASSLPDAATSGDEPRLIATRCPGVRVFVDADRVASARAAASRGFTTLILDDGFQHRRLARSTDLVVVDAEAGFGNGRLLPAGPLREPISALSRASLIWLVRGAVTAPLPSWPCPVIEVRTRAVDLISRDGRAEPLETLRGARVVALTGIARPERFHATLRELGAEIVETSAHADHANFPAAELSRLTSLGVPIITTEKDLQRLSADFPARAVRIEHEVLQGAELLERL